MNISKTLFAALPAIGLMMTAPALHAQVTSVPLFENHFHTQTGVGTVSDDGYDFNARIFETNAGDVTDATLTYPGAGSPATYTQASYSPTIFQYDSGTIASQAALDSAYPSGTYTTSYNSGSSTVIDTLPTSAFSSSVPTYAAATYNGLQGLNAAQPFTVSWNSFAPDASVTNQYIYFDIYNSATGTNVFDLSLLPATTTSVNLPGGTLQPGTSYYGELIFDNRDESSSGGVDTTVGFDQRTTVNFTTSPVPEASTVLSFGLLLALGLGSVVMARKKSVKA